MLHYRFNRFKPEIKKKQEIETTGGNWHGRGERKERM
jgi:hypothetical protein